jgi:Protein of unknown function (DUF4242)
VAVFVIERRFAEAIELSEQDVREINLINDEENVRWLYSFLSMDRRKTYCLYEASSVEAVRRAAVRAGFGPLAYSLPARRVAFLSRLTGYWPWSAAYPLAGGAAGGSVAWSMRSRSWWRPAMPSLG